jgi:amino acid permease
MIEYANPFFHCQPNATVTPAIDCKLNLYRPTTDIFFSLGTILFAFVCHTRCHFSDASVLPIYREVPSTLKPLFGGVVHAGIALYLPPDCRSGAIYLVISIFGYLTFYDSVSSDLISSYQNAHLGKGADNPVIGRTRLLNTSERCRWILCCHAYDCACCRIPTAVSLFLTFSRSFWYLFNKDDSRDVSIPLWVLSTVLLLGICTAVAVFAQNISDVLGFAGATSSVSLAFVMPAGFWLKLASNEGPKRTRVLCWMVIVAGVVFGILCLVGQGISVASQRKKH